MNDNLDRRIEFAERRVLVIQNRLIEQRNKADVLLMRLERDSEDMNQMKQEWINKRNTEMERARLEKREICAAHRHAIDDLRVKYDNERTNKLREIKALIVDKEKEIDEWRKKRDETAMKTRQEEAQVRAKYQSRLNAKIREGRSVVRAGIVRQQRILDYSSGGPFSVKGL